MAEDIAGERPGEGPDGRRFRSVPAGDRIARRLGPMTLVYHRASGITHMVSDPVPQILEALDALGGDGGDAGAVAAWLGAQFDLRSDDDGGDVDGRDIGRGGAEAIVAARLAELAALGLVVPVVPA